VIDQVPSVKFFITGRPESRIRSGFRHPGLHPRTEVLLLHEVERGDVDEDIRLYLEYHLKELVKNQSDIDIGTPLPSKEDIQTVTSKAGGLFMYASTVINFLHSGTHSPQERIRLITSTPDSRALEVQSGIDTLYTCTANRSCAHVHDSDVSFFDRLRVVISSVVLLYEPISVASPARLLGIGIKDVLMRFRYLHSVLLVPDSESRPIQVFCKSFPDYITDHERCRDSRFYVDSPVHHERLTIRCFELAITGLKENACHIPRYAMNEDVEDLSIRRQNCIGEAMVHACRS
jgi:hypothetical protein